MGHPTCSGTNGARRARMPGRRVPDSIHFVPGLETDVQFVKGIGPRIGESLKAKGVATVEDLLYHLPFRYEDRLHPMPLNELKPGEMASVIGEVRGTVLLRTRSMPIFEMTVGQGISSVKCMWFHGTYLKDRFKSGQMLARLRQGGGFALRARLQDDSAAGGDFVGGRG